MVSMINMPVSVQHAKDRIKTNFKYNLQSAATMGTAATGAYLLAPKATTSAAKNLFSGIANHSPQAKNIVSKVASHLKNFSSQTKTCWNALPPQAKIVLGIGAAALGLLSMKNIYDNGRLDGKHNAVKDMIKNTNQSGWYA